ncbi:amidohydrolase [Alkalicoccus luteus]|uniref:amidohydrolase n=1 Tax=Alkalicoccus luteus TaxID=1237094 RepID=UPI004033F9F6
MSWSEAIAAKTEQLTALRRKLHQIAEPGWCEYQTTAAIVSELSELPVTIYTGTDAVESSARMGLPSAEEDAYFFQLAEKAGLEPALLERMQGGHTGAVAVLDTGKPGPDTALRFDIDALPITEAAAEHFPADAGFPSRHPGYMHACGHDGHTAIGVELVKLCVENVDQLTGTLTFLFQPAEEGSRGAYAMVEKGWLDGKDYFFSGHIGIHDLEVGTIACGTERFLATTKLDVTFTGVSAHAGVDPAAGKNALLAAASAAIQLQAIPPHRDGIIRLNVGKLTAGEGRNIIPERAEMMMETRGETNELNNYMEEEARRILTACADMYGVEVTIDVVGQGSTTESSKAIGAKLSSWGEQFTKRVIGPLPLGGSEDAALMMNRVREQNGEAAYLLYGTPLPYGHHHPKFTFDEGVLPAAVEALAQLVTTYHEKERVSR